MNKIALILLCLLLSGCTVNKNSSVKTAEDVKVVSVSRVDGNKIEENKDFFIGADITEDTNVDGISAFEEKTGVHELYADEIYINEADKAAAFMLECYAAGKTPYIILKNREGISTEQFKSYADELAQAVGKYHLEVMVEILENSYYYDENGENYKYTAEKIAESNDLAEFVWSVKSDDIILVGKYMPEEYVDFICVNGYYSSDKAADRMFSELRKHLNTDKRVIVRFGAVYYSSSDCAYTPDDAKKTIETVYNRTFTDKGIAGVIYMDKNKKLSERINFTDYSVTSDKKLIQAYSDVINGAAEYKKEMSQ